MRIVSVDDICVHELKMESSFKIVNKRNKHSHGILTSKSGFRKLKRRLYPCAFPLLIDNNFCGTRFLSLFGQ